MDARLFGAPEGPIDTSSSAFSSDLPTAAYYTSPEHHVSEENSPNAQGGRNSIFHAPGLNPRSCVTCRKRKVKCDKKQPCSNCIRGSVECVFPRPGRAPRQSKKPPDSELLSRLRRLEGVVQQMGMTVDGDEAIPGTEESPDAKESREDSPAMDGIGPGTQTKWNTPQWRDKWKAWKGTNCPIQQEGSRDPQLSKMEKELGRLVIGDGRSRYVSNSFWAGLTEELTEMRTLIDHSSDEEDEHGSSETNVSDSRLTHQEFIFGYSSTMLTLRILHPQPKLLMTYWDQFKINVNPIIRILHRPTVEQLYIRMASDLDHVSRSAEALMFAIYLAVVTSMTREDCQLQLDIDKETALKRYRYATEQALARAGFMETQEVLVLQAFTIFLISIRRYDDNKLIWSMVGLAVRIANSLGLHRDGTNFGLNPFDTEMRRRIWWQVCTLDVRVSEEHGSDPLLTQQNFDTELPLNLNDDDIWPGMDHPPIEHEIPTEMTFDLVRYEIGAVHRALFANPKTGRPPLEGEDELSIEAKDALIEKLRLRLEDKYLRYCDMSNPLHWVSANVARLILAKLWLIVHHPFKRADKGAGLPSEIKDRTFLTSIDIIRYSRILETQQKAIKWGWLFRTYFQWHAVAFLLTELCRRVSGPEVEEAWRVIDYAFMEWDDMTAGYTKSVLWKPLVKLLAKARAARANELGKLPYFRADGSPGSKHASSSSNTMNAASVSRSCGVDNFESTATDLDRTLNIGRRSSAAVSQGVSNSMLDVQGNQNLDGWAQSEGVTSDALVSGWNMEWEGWDEFDKDFQTQAEQPVPFSMGALWGDPSSGDVTTFNIPLVDG